MKRNAIVTAAALLSADEVTHGRHRHP